MKGYADAMATIGSPLPDEELIDYILAGLDSAFAPLQASLNVYSNTNPTATIQLSNFYSMLISHEAMQDQPGNELDFSSLANAARRGDYGRNTVGSRVGAQQGGGYPGGGRQGGGGPQYGGYQGQGGGGGSYYNGGGS